MEREKTIMPLCSIFIFTFIFPLSLPRPSISLPQETNALLQFKSRLIDPSNTLQSWIPSNSPCQFHGVTCDPHTHRVTAISLDDNSLAGPISPSISVLQDLKFLNLSYNYFNGTIPDLSSLAALETLDLSVNDFSGMFPVWVGNLTRLVSLGLGDNNFDEGEIPDTIGRLKNLQWLYLAGSNLRSHIPESIFELERLGTLDMCRNKISGNFPTSIGRLKNLFKIELYKNNLTGEIPPGVSQLTFLQEFDVSNNQMHGTIPPEIGNLKRLTVFHLFNNNFSGEIPAAFGDMQHLIAFSIYRNRFSGDFPQHLGRFSPLNSIDISENQFSGAFPRYLCQNGSLQNLLALDNNFSGEFPDTYAKCYPLQRLRINHNRLNGMIPDGVWALPNVQVMDFRDNDFTGRVSPSIGHSLHLNELMLSNNRFSGELPIEIGQLTQLERIYLNHNNFTGRIPSEIGALKQIWSLHLEVNEFSGSIPSELADCPRLADLNLASNSLTGNIPNTFSRMASLNSLNLSRNRLTGSVPSNFDKMKLSSVDLSDNHLSGIVPPYLLTWAADKAFVGNEDLCVDNDSSRKYGNSGLRTCDRINRHKNFIKSKLVMFFVVLFTLVVILGGLVLISYRSFKQNQNREENKRLGKDKSVNSNWKLESFQQVEFDVEEICNLDEHNLIGSGSTGKVYRLDLKKGCGIVAVKQLWKGNGVKLMAAEMEILSKIRHRNILKLYACLSKGGSNFLVFEYMVNGNLYQALDKDIKEGKPELDWHQRYKIALGAAKGIAYLHHDCSPAIIHRDIKSTNILLDEYYDAKVADFGVAKVADQVSPRGSEMSCFAGTYGYIAPEMAYSLIITEKCDVYSFGVVLLELVTGRKPIEDKYGDGKDIVYWVSTHLNSRDNLIKILDPEVVGEHVQHDAIKVLKIAILCTSKLPNLRPSMKEVVKMLIDAEPCGLGSTESLETKDHKTYV